MVNARAEYHRAYREKNRAALIEKSRQWRLANPERAKANEEAYRGKNKEKLGADALARYYAFQERNRKQQQAWKRGVRLKVIEHYGGKCACCGEAKLEFLGIDHINGGGNKHRAELKTRGGSGIYRHLIKAGYPEGYRVLCHNCNLSYGLYGYCPHRPPPPGYVG
jgi:hypothetical protein